MADFSRALGVPRSTAVGWEDGKVAPIGLLVRLETAYGVNPDWFLTGSGPMFRDSQVGHSNELHGRTKFATVANLNSQHDPSAVREALADHQRAPSADVRPDLPAIKNHEHRGVPYYDVEASAHIAEVLEGGDRQPEFYIDFQPFNDCTAYLTVYGDSMYPAIQSGEVIAVKEIRSLDVLLWGEKYLVITNEEANNLRTVKLVHQHEDDSKIILRASNPNFKGDTVIRKESIVKMFLVKGKISRGHL